MNLKFHLHKFEKQLYFQLLDFNKDLVWKGFVDKENDVCVVFNEHWTNKFIVLDKLRAGNWSTSGETFYINLHSKLNEVVCCPFKSNEERDFWYDKILLSISRSFTNKSWIDSNNV